jgi:hypothetical protein
MHRQVILILLALVLAMLSTQARATTPIPTEADHATSLNGKWRFKIEQAPLLPQPVGKMGRNVPATLPAVTEPFHTIDYKEDASWHDITVPGNWEMAGFSPATYNQPDNASGFYRLRFAVPAGWQGRQVKINFDGVQNGCEIWCNGKPVSVDRPSWGRENYHEGGWTAWQADLTPAIQFGQENLLALHVTKNTKSVDCDTGDYFFLGGVHRPVTLFAVPATYLRDITVRTKLLPDDQAEVTVIAQVANPAAGGKVSVSLEGQPNMEGAADAAGEVTLTQTIPHPGLWSAEFPNLYPLSVDLKDANGQVTEHTARKIGIREVSIKDGIFQVNHVPVKLVGICRHDVHPTMGTAVNEEVWKNDLELMKAANFNAVRTSHYPYGSGFYDLCDRMGFYVIDEEPFCWVNCDDPKLPAAFEQRARETVQRDKNHPCVVIWGIGNENKPGRDNALAAKVTREMDPTRPRLISCQKADDGDEHVEFDDVHYRTVERIHQAELDSRRAKWPMIYTENPNVWEVRNGPDYGCLDLWCAVIDRTWREIWKDEHVVGTFLWEWQDRAVADPNETKYYYYFPQTGINLLKVKGVVDGFRTPRAEYFHIKMAQSPIVIDDKPKEVSVDTIVLNVTNHYSFTDLSKLKLRWSLSAGSQQVQCSGTVSPSLPPRSQGTVRLTFPQGALAAADTLRLDIEHPDGWNIATYQVVLKPITYAPPQLQAAGVVTFPRFNLLTGQVVKDDKGWRLLDRVTGELAHIRVSRQGQQVEMAPTTLTATPLTEVQSLDADIVLQPKGGTAGRLHAEFADGKFSYRVDWLGEKSDIYELGWVFAAPKGVDHFSWSRQGVWSYYPPDHIGRPNGTATPDSADVQVTKITRPDAFDFNSTKFNCDWAALSDSAGGGGGGGKGLCVEFSPDQRQHVRGGIEADGACSLIVNRCYSPPRDISSTVVADLYTVLNKNDQVSGRFKINGAP